MARTDDRSGAARVAAKHEAAQAYQHHLARVRASSWRLAKVDGWWRVARNGPDTYGWDILEDKLQAFEDIDGVAERRRYCAWIRELLGVTSTWLYRDYAADRAGRVAFEIVVVR